MAFKLETERLIIRPFERDDIDQFRSLLEIEESEGWTAQRDRMEEFLDWQISNYQRMDIVRGVVCMGVFDRAGNILGRAGAGEHDDLHEPEVFYALRPGARGQGYATEACAAVTEWALANYDIPYIIGTAAVDNTASQRVLERCGYRFVDERELLVHVLDKSYRFRYYRHYRA